MLAASSFPLECLWMQHRGEPSLSRKATGTLLKLEPVLLPSKQEAKHSRGSPESQSLFSFSLHP